MPHFADRLAAATKERKSAVCVGIDPRVTLLPSEFRPNRDSPAAHAECVAAWARALLEVVAPLAAVVKPNLGFFEALGAPGFRAYHEVVLAAQERGLLVVADAKRGDIGNTAQSYAEGHFDTLGADAITLNPFQGRDSLEPFLQYARRGKGFFVLVKTSNAGSADVQDLIVGDRPLYRHVARMVRELGEGPGQVGACGWSAVGAVVGATHPRELAALREDMPKAVFLVPGYGAQGGTADDCAAAFAEDGTGAVVNSSRGITFAFRSGEHAQAYGDANWRESVRAATRDMRDALEAARARRFAAA